MSILLSAIPLPYKIGAVALVTLVLVGGSASWGYLKGSSKSAAVIAQYVAKNADLEKTIAEGQGRIVERVVTKYVDRIVKVKEVEVHNVQVANDVVPDREYLSIGWLYTHDAAVSGINADTASAADATSSTTQANTALATITSNYAQCHATEEQLINLQDWVTATKANIDAQNALALKRR